MMAGKMRARRITGLVVLMAAGGAASAQQSASPLTNADIIKMVKAGVPESVVIASIRSGPANFDTTPDGLIALHKAGLTAGELDAMSSPNSGAAQAAAAPAVPAGPRWRLPSTSLLSGGAAQELPLEATQLAQTKTKPTSMTSLATDSMTTKALVSGIGIASNQVLSQMTPGVGAGVVQEASSLLAGVLASRKPVVTYVWGVVGPSSATVLHATTPMFSVSFARAPGVNPDEYAPQIVKLTPAQNTCRLVGATEGAQDAQSSSAADWQIYSGFLEDRVAVNAQRLRSGEYQVSPKSPLLPGEYGVVLRPVSKNKKFAGAEVARGQGDGQMFQIVWSFQVAMDST
jgi:hypothetical protein